MRNLAARLSPEPEPAERPLPYGLHSIDEADAAAVLSTLGSGLLAQGPKVAEFEKRIAATVQAGDAVACSSGTAALHLALAALDVGPSDLCVVPAVTFLSTATAARLCGAEVVFCDVDPRTGLMTPATLAEALGRAPGPVKAVLPVHLGGRLCEVEALARLASEAGAVMIEDACHALGSVGRRSGPAGSNRFGKASVFSFHPVKNIACGEGGMVTTSDAAMAARMRRLRNHGVTRDAAEMGDTALSFSDGRPNPWSYEQLELGFNYRITDLEAALGLSQLRRLQAFREKRAALAERYTELLRPLSPWLEPISADEGDEPFLHLYGVRIDFAAAGRTRASLMEALAARGVGTQVHYIPVYAQPYFRRRYGAMSLPGAEAYYERALSLPLFPAMELADVDRVCLALAAELAR